MNAILPGLLTILLAPAAGTAMAQVATPAPTPTLTPDECEVWARELSFARSVADHDAVAFAAHLHEHAVFGAKRAQPTRGRDAIAARWAGIVSGETLELQWYPAMVAIGGDGDLAYSSGPSLYRSAGPDGAELALGAFQSVWQRGDDGVWRIVFDDGIEPVPATPAQAEAFAAGRRTRCPSG